MAISPSTSRGGSLPTPYTQPLDLQGPEAAAAGILRIKSTSEQAGSFGLLVVDHFDNLVFATSGGRLAIGTIDVAGGGLRFQVWEDYVNDSDPALAVAFVTGVTVGKTGGNVGFYGATPGARPTVAGSKGGNAALGSLLSALATLGLITDSTT